MRRTHLTRARYALLSACLATAILGFTSSAKADYVHKYGGTTFSVVGTPTTVAVDDQSGSVYVLTTSGQLEKFTSAGAPAAFSALASTTLTTGCEATCRGLAVDNSGGPNQGVIYVGHNGEGGIAVFLPTGAAVGPITNTSAHESGKLCGVAVDASGVLYATSLAFDNLIDRYSLEPWATHPSQTPTITGTLLPDFGNPCKAAVDSQGNLYVIPGGGAAAFNALRKIPSGSFGTPDGEKIAETTVVEPNSTYPAVDLETDEVYTDRKTEIARLTPSGQVVEAFGSAEIGNSFGVAINSATKTVYVSDQADESVSIYPKYNVPNLSGFAAATAPGEATLKGHVELAGGGNAIECEFEYRQEGEVSFAPVPCAEPLPIEADGDVSAPLSGLLENTVYEYRLVVKNENGAATGPIRKFSIAAPQIEGTFTTEVTESGAVLNARVNTHGAATEFSFEYGLTTQYGTTIPVPAGQIPAGEPASTTAQASASGLLPSIYHFRVTVTSPLGTATSEDQTFSYFPQQCANATVRQQTGSDHLPDCRAYELVSPGQAGNIILNPGILTPSFAYATNPARLSFGGVAGGINGTEPVIGLGADLYVATRTSSGWVTTLPGLKGFETQGISGVLGITGDEHLDRFFDFSGLTSFNPDGSLRRTVNIPFVWDADGTFLGRWPADAAAIPNAELTNGYFQPSPDFSHLAFSSSNVQFAPNGLLSAPGSAYDYDTKEGTTQIISWMPNGEPLQPPEPIQQQQAIHEYPGENSFRERFERDEVIAFPGIANPDKNLPEYASSGSPKDPAKVNPGISTDGSHILMSVSSGPYDGFTSYENFPRIHMYMRVNDAVTYDVSKGDRAQYIGMTADGSKVFFLSREPLTEDDHDSSDDLFMWSEATNSLTRISTGSGAGDVDTCSAGWTSQCDVKAVAINGHITDTSIASQAGSIYFYSPEQLDGTKGTAGGQNMYLYRNGSVQYVTTAEASRIDVSPDGAHMAMVTKSRLSPYDNEGFAEMYSYDSQTDKLICVSCNPTGEPPTGNVEGTVKSGLFMANDGRTFFYTTDALVPKDTNKLHDVYEYVSGHAQLISTGTGAHDVTLNQSGRPRSRAGLVGISADGVNVYFDTYETLVPEDENGEFLKFYDARSGGGFVNPAPRQPCVAADECHGATSSPPPATGIVGEGDLGSGGNVKSTSGRKKKRHRKRHGHRHHRAGHRNHSGRGGSSHG